MRLSLSNGRLIVHLHALAEVLHLSKFEGKALKLRRRHCRRGTYEGDTVHVHTPAISDLPVYTPP